MHFLINKLGLEFPVADLSRKTGYSDATVSPYVSGKVKPSTKFLQKICEVYEVDLNEFENNYRINETLHVLAEPERHPYGLIKDNEYLKKTIVQKDKQLSIYEKLIENLEEKVHDLEEMLGQKKQNGTS